MEDNKIFCPYCGSDQVAEFQGGYHCENCDWLFDDEEIKWQDLRHSISHHLIDTDEEHPIVFEPNEMPVIGENWPETFGLSTLDMYHLDKIFQLPGDGTIWFHLEGEYDETDPTGLLWHDLEEENFLILDDLAEIFDALEWRARRLAR